MSIGIPHARQSPALGDPRAALLSTACLHLSNGLDPRRDGGMVPSILGMTGALARELGGVAILTPTPSRLDPDRIPPGVSLRGPSAEADEMSEIELERAVKGAEVVHIHGLWQRHTRQGAPAARRYRVPYLIAAHGMLEPWALRHKGLKKCAYLALVEGRNLRHAACLHALSRPEVGHMRKVASRTPICLVPNGVHLAPLERLPGRERLEERHPELRGKFLLLFLGRLHEKKGLDLLASALAAVRHDHAELHLVIAGPDDGALAAFLNQIAVLGLGSRVTCLGHVSGENAREAWGAADAFILPSRSEGFSMAVLEALACRLPTIITTACHFPELAEAEAGIVVPPTHEGITQGLRLLFERSAAERTQLGNRGRELVEARYTWDRQGQRLAAVYRWLCGGGRPPECVQS
jgi:glycosyltransferase involved in cell wall biosynthesis